MEQISSFLYLPTVYAVRDCYQIIFVTKEFGAGAIIVNGKRYTDNVCGVVRSNTHIHRVEIKSNILDAAGRYTVEFKKIPDRTPYFPKTASTETAEFSFRQVPTEGDINCYVLADTHSFVDEPTKAGMYFGNKLDLLILGGDNGNKADCEDSILTMARLASNLAKGEIPVIYMRGNHDTRGAFAEFLPEYVGTDRGLTYFPIRLGRLWFVLLDQGEDKPDRHEEYGDIADYADFRSSQSDMLKAITDNARNEYEADGVDIRIGLCHVPFTACRTVFEETDSEWTSYLNKMKIHLFLSGHTHRARYIESGFSDRESEKPNFPTVICSGIDKKDISSYVGTALTIGTDKIRVSFTDVNNRVIEEHDVALKN